MTTAKSVSKPASYVQPIHFEDFGGTQFERLVFAYHWRIENWRTLEWYGQIYIRGCQEHFSPSAGGAGLVRDIQPLSP